MKKRLVSLALVFLVVFSTFVLSSCRGDTELLPVKAPIYTIYTIIEEGTTDDAVREVELALNRLTFYQLGYCVKLIAVTEDEYDDLIETTLAECKAYSDAKTAKPKPSSSSEASSEAPSSESSAEVLTGDDYIAMLERGETYELPNPRLDIFLVTGYDKYIDLVGRNQLAPLTDALSSEAKLIKDYVFPSFLEAAKITNPKGAPKTFGIPTNKGIGQYDYIVFDKEYLDKYTIDADTMTNLEDLEYYLKILAENEPDVVPLSNVFDSPEFAYLFEDGFSAFIKSGVSVNDTYTNKNVLDYFTLVARYRAMGYLKDAEENQKWAVKFIRGTFEDIDALEIQNGREYDYSIHSYPVATNEDLLSSLFCVSAYTIANELTDVAKLLNYIETNIDAANLLAYGVQGAHYTLDEKNQVVRLNNDYNMNLNYVGNTFLTYTRKGEDPEKWQKLMKQNQDSLKTAEQSASLGFAYYPVGVKDPNDNTIMHYEPNYVNIIKEECEKLYPGLISGTLADVSYEDIVEHVSPIITELLTADITASYTEKLNARVLSEMAAAYAKGTVTYEKLESKSYDAAVDLYNTASNQSKIKKETKTALAAKPENAGLTDSELDLLVAELCTPDYLLEQIILTYADKIEERKIKYITDSQDHYTKRDYDEYIKGSEYAARLEDTLTSEEYLEEMFNATGENVFVSHYDMCLVQTNLYLQTFLTEHIDEFFINLNKRLRTEYKAFQNRYLTTFDFSDDETRSEPDYRIAITNVISKAVKGRTTMESALSNELRNMVTKELGEDELPENITNTVKERLTDKWKQQVVMETFSFNKDPKFECKVATPELRAIVNDYITLSAVKDMYGDVLLASFEKAIGLVKTIEVDISSAVPEDDDDDDDNEGSEESGEAKDPDNDKKPEEEPKVPLVDLDTVDLYPIIYEKRIQSQFYAYKPLPLS